MTTLATAERAPMPWRRPTYRELVEEREHLLDLLADARDWARTLELVAVGIVVERRAERPHDVEAERRVLGGLANGRATLRDVADLEAADFLGDGHASLFAALVRIRRSLAREVNIFLDEPAFERVVAMAGGGAGDVWDVLQGLPRPAACPRRDIVRVEELARWRRATGP